MEVGSAENKCSNICLNMAKKRSNECGTLERKKPYIANEAFQGLQMGLYG